MVLATHALVNVLLFFFIIEHLLISYMQITFTTKNQRLPIHMELKNRVAFLRNIILENYRGPKVIEKNLLKRLLSLLFMKSSI